MHKRTEQTHFRRRSAYQSALLGSSRIFIICHEFDFISHSFSQWHGVSSFHCEDFFGFFGSFLCLIAYFFGSFSSDCCSFVGIGIYSLSSKLLDVLDDTF
ncbi:hypothetical protein QL285_006288 [Trifolium repens]|nr:hypothetical protein QL285_006288 [Trifolium repens]